MTGDHNKQSEALTTELKMYGGFGLVDMAMRLAEQRGAAKYPTQNLEGFWTELKCLPADRDRALGDEAEMFPISREYYNIIDCIVEGHQWRAEKEFNSCARCHAVKANRDFKPGEFHSGR